MMKSPLHLSNFRWLWLGQTLIFCAAQFWFVALTWLVLQKTGSGFAIGTVLMAAAIPRGLLMLVGGAISDRLPPSYVAVLASLTNTILVGLVTLMLLVDSFGIPALAIISALFGASEAFLYPSILTLLPRIISKSRLRLANAWMQFSEQITNVIGPAAAGLVIGAFGLTTAFVMNTAMFAIGMVFIYLVRTRRNTIAIPLKPHALTGEIVEGLRYAWHMAPIRISLLLIAMINFAILGPIVIGVAELVRVRFGGDATTFGYLQSAYGIGALLGVFIAGQLNGIKQLKTPLILLACVLGMGLIALGFAPHTWVAATIILLMGIGGGIVGVLGISWLQQQTSIPMLGRMMSLVMFASVGLDPFSQAVTGMLLDINLTVLFMAAGITMLVTALVSFTSKS